MVLPDLLGKLDYPVLFFSRKPLDLIDDFNRCHAVSLRPMVVRRKFRNKIYEILPGGQHFLLQSLESRIGAQK